MVSVCVAVYNKSEDELTRCFESILSQTNRSFELIITDDGSLSEVAEFLDKYAISNNRRCEGGIHLVHYSNGGVWVARNRGQERALGDWIIHVNADDYIHNRTLETALEAGEIYPDVDMVYWGLTVYNNPNQYRNFGGNRLYAEPTCERFFIRQELLLATPFCDVTCMVRREKALLFDTDLVGAEFERQVRVIASCRAVYFVDKPLYHYIPNDNSISSTQVDLNWRIESLTDFRKALVNNGFKIVDEYLISFAVFIVHYAGGSGSLVFNEISKTVVREILCSVHLRELRLLNPKMMIISFLFRTGRFFLLDILLRVAKTWRMIFKKRDKARS